MFKKNFFFLVMQITVSFDCIHSAIVSANSKSVNSYAAAYNPCADIRNGQIVCVDCETVAFCVQEGGDWVTFEYEKCRADKSMYCNESVKGCALQRDCTLPKRGIKFECQNPGKYPDPYDCKLYHDCSNTNVDTRTVCPTGTIYSVAKQSCEQGSANSDQCKQAQYQCDRQGMMGAWPDDQNIYYICNVKRIDDTTVMYPLLYRCSTGFHFDGEKCVSSGNPKPPQSKCGNNNGLTAHPTNCRAYMRCVGERMITEQCPADMYFNTNRLQCESGNC